MLTLLIDCPVCKGKARDDMFYPCPACRGTGEHDMYYIDPDGRPWGKKEIRCTTMDVDRTKKGRTLKARHSKRKRKWI